MEDVKMMSDFDTFCFVNIDVDLYQPTKDALEFFIQKLSKGGYIFIHDYNNYGYRGIRINETT